MKTEVKFRELPEKVQGFLSSDKFDQFWTGQDDIRLSWLHNLPEWNQANDDERLAYAEWRYPVGTVLAKSGINDWVRPEILMPIENCKFSLHENIIDTQDGYGYVYCKKTNRWAETVSLPDIKEASPESQQEFVKANPGMQHVEEPKEINDKSSVEIFTDQFNEACKNQDKSNCPLAKPKAGDMVEGSWDGTEWEPDLFFTGGKSVSGSFICQNKKNEIRFKDKIRLPQKSEVESKVKEILNYYNNQFSEFYKEGEQRTKQMILTAIKWGQANPDKI